MMTWHHYMWKYTYSSSGPCEHWSGSNVDLHYSAGRKISPSLSSKIMQVMKSSLHPSTHPSIHPVLALPWALLPDGEHLKGEAPWRHPDQTPDHLNWLPVHSKEQMQQLYSEIPLDAWDFTPSLSPVPLRLYPRPCPSGHYAAGINRGDRGQPWRSPTPTEKTLDLIARRQTQLSLHS